MLVRILAGGDREVALLLPLDSGEEGGVAPELLAFPVAERVVVALGALDLDAEEQAGGGAARFSGLSSLAR